MSSVKRKKPGRPFGVTLAILASVMLYTVIPLIQVGAILLVENHFRRVDETPIPGQMGAGISGGDFRGGISNEQLILQSSVAIGFLIIALIAWRGKPQAMRYVFMAVVFALAVLSVVTSALPASQSGSVSGGSADDLAAIWSTVALIARSLLVPLYVIWYMNRGPARAFYRGYYLDDAEQGAHAPEAVASEGSDAEPIRT